MRRRSYPAMSLVAALGLAALLLPGRTTEVARASADPTPALNTSMVSAIAGGPDGSVALVGRFSDAVTIGDRTIRSDPRSSPHRGSVRRAPPTHPALPRWPRPCWC